MTANIFIDSDADQSAQFDASAWTVQAVTSKKVLFATLFAGLGYSNYDVDFGLLGNYTTETQTCNNLISLNYAHNGVSANVGIRLKLLFLTLHGEYAIQDYNTLTAGVSIR